MNFMVGDLLSHLEINSFWDFIKVIVDIAIITFVVYKILKLMKETRAWQLVKGIATIFIAAKITELFGLRTLAYFLNNTIQPLSYLFLV